MTKNSFSSNSQEAYFRERTMSGRNNFTSSSTNATTTNTHANSAHHDPKNDQYFDIEQLRRRIAYLQEQQQSKLEEEKKESDGLYGSYRSNDNKNEKKRCNHHQHRQEVTASTVGNPERLKQLRQQLAHLQEYQGNRPSVAIAEEPEKVQLDDPSINSHSTKVDEERGEGGVENQGRRHSSYGHHHHRDAGRSGRKKEDLEDHDMAMLIDLESLRQEVAARLKDEYRILSSPVAVAEIDISDTTTTAAPPPLAPVKDFTVKEQPSTDATGWGINKKKRFCTYVLTGLCIIIGIILASVVISNLISRSEEDGGEREEGNSLIVSPPSAPGVAPPPSSVPPPTNVGSGSSGGNVGEDDNTVKISLKELSLHNTPDDCWVALHGTVYDLTSYARRHPAGASIITQLAGTDGTMEYRRFHSQPLLQSVEADIIGRLEGSSSNGSGNNQSSPSPPNQGQPPAPSPPSNGNGSGGCSNSNMNCISIQELAQHNTANDCWVVLYGNVYDLTNYAQRHPGGSGTITQLAGIDGTRSYTRFHGPNLLTLRFQQEYLVGELESSFGSNGSGSGSGIGGGNQGGGDWEIDESEDDED